MPAYMLADELRIPISAAYLEGREAHANGVHFLDNPYSADQSMNRLDWSTGFSDASDGVSIEFRQLAEENGERV